MQVNVGKYGSIYSWILAPGQQTRRSSNGESDANARRAPGCSVMIGPTSLIMQPNVDIWGHFLPRAILVLTYPLCYCIPRRLSIGSLVPAIAPVRSAVEGSMMNSMSWLPRMDVPCVYASHWTGAPAKRGGPCLLFFSSRLFLFFFFFSFFFFFFPSLPFHCGSSQPLRGAFFEQPSGLDRAYSHSSNWPVRMVLARLLNLAAGADPGHGHEEGVQPSVGRYYLHTWSSPSVPALVLTYGTLLLSNLVVPPSAEEARMNSHVPRCARMLGR